MSHEIEGAAYNRASELFLRAVDLPPAERDSLLQAACADDADLRSRVERLLENDSHGTLLDGEDSEAPGVVAESSFLGMTVGRYQVIDKIGEGGMAMVYRAVDTTLDRTVALKFLSPLIARHPQSRERFVREAKAAAAIDHPNVCPVYEINPEPPYPYIAMAYLEGRTLAGCLSAGQLDLSSGVEIAIQVCRGLEAAHSKGIVHRDIKPANLLISQTSSRPIVRILDFGIARLAERSGLTRGGLTIGTVAYMSPEQVESPDVDARADLWALGVVLYRMIAGKLPFERKTTRETLAAITGASPVPIHAHRSDVPATLTSIVDKAMQKDPEHRYQQAAELIRDLEGVARELDRHDGNTSHAVPLQDRHLKATFRRVLLLAGLLIAAVGSLLWYRRTAIPERSTSELLTPERLTSYLGAEDHAAISPDGTRIAFTWNGESASGTHDIYIRLLDSQSLLRITNTRENEHSVAWSPDGTKLAFLRQHGAKRSVIVVPSLGGAEHEVAEIDGLGTDSLDWNPRRDLLVLETSRGIVLLSLTDGTPKPFTLPGDLEHDVYPSFDPSGTRLAFMRRVKESAFSIHVVPLDGGQPQIIHPKFPSRPFGDYGRAFTWNARGDGFIGRALSTGLGGPLLAIAIPGGEVTPTDLAERSADLPHVRGSLLAYTRRELDTDIWELPLSPEAARAGKPRVSIASSMREDSPDVSPDGRFVVFSSDRSGSQEIWKCNRDGSGLVRLTNIGGVHAGSPRWSPDGKWIAFDATREDRLPHIYLVNASGGEVRRLTTLQQMEILPSWSHDGRTMYFATETDHMLNVWRYSLASAQLRQITRKGGFESFASPDGRFLYYSEPGGSRILHRLDLENSADRAFPELGQAGIRRYWAVSANGQIYFVDPAGKYPRSIQRFDPDTRHATTISELGATHWGPRGLALTPDGRTLFVVQQDKDDADIMLVRNFR